MDRRDLRPKLSQRGGVPNGGFSSSGHEDSVPAMASLSGPGPFHGGKARHINEYRRGGPSAGSDFGIPNYHTGIKDYMQSTVLFELIAKFMKAPVRLGLRRFQVADLKTGFARNRFWSKPILVETGFCLNSFCFLFFVLLNCCFPPPPTPSPPPPYFNFFNDENCFVE